MTFGFSTLVDLLSWTAALLLGVKIAATLILLSRDRKTWFRTRSGPVLWWATKLTPLLAVPCVFAGALVQHDMRDARIYAGLMVFAAVAVAVVVWKRFHLPDRDTS